MKRIVGLLLGLVMLFSVAAAVAPCPVNAGDLNRITYAEIKAWKTANLSLYDRLRVDLTLIALEIGKTIAGPDAWWKFWSWLSDITWAKDILSNVAGFQYDKGKRIWYGTEHAPIQSIGGFSNGIGTVAPLIGCIIDEITTVFVSPCWNDKCRTAGEDIEWSIRAWKGHYGMGLGTGGEMGVYWRYKADIGVYPYYTVYDPEIGFGLLAFSQHFKTAKMFKLPMHFDLKYGRKSGILNTIFSRDSTDYDYVSGARATGDIKGSDWWMLGIMLGVQYAVDDLTMDCWIRFPNQGMAQSFVAALTTGETGTAVTNVITESPDSAGYVKVSFRW